jgi:hypothetical protein
MLLLTPVSMEAYMPLFFKQWKTLEDSTFIPLHSLQDLAFSRKNTVKKLGKGLGRMVVLPRKVRGIKSPPTKHPAGIF